MSKKKLQLKKITIHSFESQLDGEEQKKVNGGAIDARMLATLTPVFCPPKP